ncbi:MAG TPA: pyrroloquinoline quinone biosynthesis protein PqqB [Candidatus Saccharimonadales bacterium]|nr:pyrroloquinoline quinone biosynthesis protein PqqB [Candidatus Saccharimonadales bacterium]
MQIRVLGCAAGGGIPQWNCNCPNCIKARKRGDFLAQSSAAVSADGKNWLLLNASPDLVFQFASCAAITPSGKNSRGSPVQAVILTDGEMDHVAGLLSLREQKSLRLICTSAVKNLLTEQFPLLPALEKYCGIHHSTFPVRVAGIRISALELQTDKAPRYARRSARRGDVVGLRLEANGKSFVYLPGLPAINKTVNKFVTDCDCLLVDGTFWSQSEMVLLGMSQRTARDMGHVPIDGEDGSLEWLRSLKIPRKIYTHINNTNPILQRTSRERRMVELAGVEISHDGMNIRL